jgi:Transglycosylase SLT domain
VEPPARRPVLTAGSVLVDRPSLPEAARRRAADRLVEPVAAGKTIVTAWTTLRPAAPTADLPTGPIRDIVAKAFSAYGPAAVAWGLRVAACESGFNPRAHDPAGPYYGLFQFAMPTFRATPYGGQDIDDPAANAGAAAWKYANGGASAWGCA